MAWFKGRKRGPPQRASERFSMLLLAVFWLGVNPVSAQFWSGGVRPIQPPFPPNAYIPPPPPLGYPPQPPVLEFAQPPFPPNAYIPPPLGYPPQPSAPASPQDTNNVEPWPYSDQEIRENVGNEFAADPSLRPFGIHADVRDGVVILTGTSDSWQDATRAQVNAYAAGARSVENRLRVEMPY